MDNLPSSCEPAGTARGEDTGQPESALGEHDGVQCEDIQRATSREVEHQYHCPLSFDLRNSSFLSRMALESMTQQHRMD